LIELLVVIAIIALLVSILLPSLQRAKELAKDMKCRTNLHAAGRACAMYAAEGNGLFPSWETIGGSSYRVLPGMTTDLSDREEIYGLPAVLNKGGFIEEKGEIWQCPKNKEDAEKFGQTYVVNNNDLVTQDIRKYAANTSGYWLADNWNLNPYPSGYARTDKGPMGQGMNTGFFRPNEKWRYYHEGETNRGYRVNEDFLDPGEEPTPRYGRGVYIIFLDLNVGFRAHEEIQR
jgi:type II secretory pathway pseudopilin PulG